MRPSPFVRALRGGLLPAALLLAAGCGAKPPEAVAPETAVQTMDDAFAQAPAEVKTLADQARQAMGARDFPRAHLLLQALLARTDLTVAQQDHATRALFGVAEELQKLAAEGDAKAQEFRRLHQSSK